jgi:predicted secreted protein
MVSMPVGEIHGIERLGVGQGAPEKWRDRVAAVHKKDGAETAEDGRVREVMIERFSRP